MKKLLILLFSIFFLSSPSVFADDIDLYELSIKYPQCQNSTYRDECFDDYSDGKDGKDRWAGYFRDNLLWEGLIWENGYLTLETYEGAQQIKCPSPVYSGCYENERKEILLFCKTATKDECIEKMIESGAWIKE